MIEALKNLLCGLGVLYLLFRVGSLVVFVAKNFVRPQTESHRTA